MSIFRYSSSDAVGDLVAGITVGLTVIPQALAYAGIAGVGPAVCIFIICRNNIECGAHRQGIRILSPTYSY